MSQLEHLDVGIAATSVGTCLLVILSVVVWVYICSLLCAFCIFLFFVTLPKTNIAPENRSSQPENKSSQKERSVCQPSIFRCELLVPILPQNMTPDCPIQPWHNPNIGSICWYITMYIYIYYISGTLPLILVVVDVVVVVVVVVVAF